MSDAQGMQIVSGIDSGSIARELGVEVGDRLLTIDGQPVLDVVDYKYLTAGERLILTFLSPGGEVYEADVEKSEDEPLGLQFKSSLMSDVRECKNHCLFCFIDQMPKPSRKSLRFKDDDWRLSFIMGNYISLTNVDDEEFSRILDRRVSPLYISVHATDPAVRVRLMRNKAAGRILERLRALRDANITFHCQIVCCPGINDGDTLNKTLNDLYALYPAAGSVAVVPLGLTRFREGLYPLRVSTRAEAEATLEQIDAFNKSCVCETGGDFVYASDEYVLIAGRALPSYDSYGDFPQIENGVGLLRLFERGFLDALSLEAPLSKPFGFDAAGGVAANPFFRELYGRLRPYNIECELHAVTNDYFGHSVTVGGLVTGGDLVEQLRGKLVSGVLLLPHNMLREGEDVFLDGWTLEGVSKALGVSVIPVRGDGEEWVRVIFRAAKELG